MRQQGHNEDAPDIPLLVVGFDFRRASASMREKLVTSPEIRHHLFDTIKKTDQAAGILVLETCNRLEWIVSTDTGDWIAAILETWMLSRWQESFPEMSNFPSPYVYKGKEAVIHVLRVVVGLESLAAGEAQIAGQFHTALKQTQKEKTSSPEINRLGHIAGRIAKSGYRIGFRANYRQGIHGLSVQFIQTYLIGPFHMKKILVAGMGEIGRRTAGLIEETLSCKVQRLNRTITPSHQCEWLPLSDLAALIPEADVLVVATGSPAAFFKPEDLGLLPMLTHHPYSGKKLLILDIGIPRQITEPLQHHPQVVYRTIDDLLESATNSEKNSCLPLLEAEIEKEFLHFQRFCRGREMSGLLAKIHSGRLELTEKLIPGFVASQLSDLDQTRQKKIQKAMKQFIRDYSNQLFNAFHDTMEKYWSTNGNGK